MLKLVYLFVITTLLAITSSTASLSSKSQIGGRADFSLANFLLARANTAAAPQSAQCFNIYLPLLQNSNDQWAAEYQLCLDDAEKKRTSVLSNLSEQQKNISSNAGSVCKFIASCDAISDALTSIDCYSTLSTNTISTIYTVSNSATDIASVVRQAIINIDTDQYRCTNTSERLFIERSAKLYDALDYCLKYGPPATVAPPPTSTVTPPSTSTVTPPSTSTVTPPSTSTVTPPSTSTVTPPSTSTVTPPPTSTVTPPPTYPTTDLPDEFQDLSMRSAPLKTSFSESIPSELKNEKNLKSLLQKWLQRNDNEKKSNN